MLSTFFLTGNGEIDSTPYTITTIISGTTLTTASGDFANTAFKQTGKYLLPSGTTDGDVEYYLLDMMNYILIRMVSLLVKKVFLVYSQNIHLMHLLML